MSDIIMASLGLSTSGMPASAAPISSPGTLYSSLHPVNVAPPGPAPLSDSQGTYVDITV